MLLAVFNIMVGVALIWQHQKIGPQFGKWDAPVTYAIAGLNLVCAFALIYFHTI